MHLLETFLDLALEVAPWLLVGLVLSGLIKAFLPEDILRRWIGGAGPGAIGRAAIIGAPLPLCSCGAIPTGLALHRAGAGRGPTAAFMISTPGIGVNSIALSYALLGPVMMLARVCGALAAAMATGLLVAAQRRTGPTPAASGPCCAGKSCSTGHAPVVVDRATARLRAGMRYAFVDMLDDIGPWMLGGLSLAAIILSTLPPEALSGVLTGIPMMLLMAVIGVPIYICASAATPIAGAMLLAGVSPGTALVFLLAGPITSLATLTVIWREMGTETLLRYFLGVIASAMAAGLVLDQIVGLTAFNVTGGVGHVQDLLPAWLSWTALCFLILAAIRPLRRVSWRPAWF